VNSDTSEQWRKWTIRIIQARVWPCVSILQSCMTTALVIVT